MSDEQETQFNKEAFEKFIEDEYGLTSEDLRWFRNYHRSVTKYGDWVAKAIVSSLVIGLISGLLTIFFYGIKAAIAMIGK